MVPAGFSSAFSCPAAADVVDSSANGWLFLRRNELKKSRRNDVIRSLDLTGCSLTAGDSPAAVVSESGSRDVDAVAGISVDFNLVLLLVFLAAAGVSSVLECSASAAASDLAADDFPFVFFFLSATWPATTSSLAATSTGASEVDGMAS